MLASRFRPCLPALAFVLAAFAATPSRAGLIVTVEPSVSSAGGTGSFDVLLSSNGGTFGVGGFSLELSVASASGVKFTSVTTNTILAPYLFGTLQGPPFSFSMFPTTDFIASDSDFAAPGFVNVTPTSPFGLEHVNYSVAAGTPVGPITVSIVGLTGLAPTSQIDDINGNPFAFTPVNGAIAIAAPSSVPEPGSLVLCGVGIVGLTTCLRRHRAG